MEQCSSEQTAVYKAELAARLLGLSVSITSSSDNAENSQNPQNSKICEFTTERAVGSEFAKNEGTFGNQQILTKNGPDVNEIEFVDLTGGFGVDFSYIAARLGVKSMYVERQAHLCEAAKENFARLGLKNAIVKNGDGVEVLHSLAMSNNCPLAMSNAPSSSLPKTSSRLKLIFIDPARRDEAGNKVVSLKDCTPDVTQLQDEMLAKADYVIIKLSPMLDWHRAVSELSHVREVHIISVNNECKELLLVLSAKNMGENISQSNKPSPNAASSDALALNAPSLKVFCVNDHQQMSYEETDDSSVTIADVDSQAMQYLYEPNASLMKAGCFGVISQRYGLRMLAKNSHLFVSTKDTELVEDFPGRTFRILAVSSFNKKELKRHLAGITKANIATRNFPLSVAELRKRLKLKDGGDMYIFATTLSDDSHVLVITKK